MQGRSRQRHHVNPLGLSFERFTGERPRVAPGARVEIEVGCADAQFLFERAAVEPERTYVGIEIRNPLVKLVNRQARESGAPVQAIFANANHHLAELFAPSSVARVYLNFPDPWFKRRHHKRRMIDGVLVRAIAEVLEPDGEVLVQSDVWAIALDALSVFERAGAAFTNLAGPWSFWKRDHPYGARSWRERNCQDEGLKVWRLLFRRSRCPHPYPHRLPG